MIRLNETPMESRPALIIFDLDGTLIDSAPDVERAINHTLRSYDCPPLTLAEVKLLIGDGAPNFVERVLASRGLSPEHHAVVLAAFVDFYDSHAIATAIYPDVEVTLATLRSQGFKLAVCTNKLYRSTMLTLERLGLAHHFDHIVGGDSFPFRKPDPRMLGTLLAHMRVAPRHSLMVGDSAIDGAAALAARVPFVLVTYGYHRGALEKIDCAARIDEFSHLMTLLSR